MNVSLTPEHEAAVRARAESGHYNDASEGFRETLRISLKLEAENDWLKREAAIGSSQLEAGETVEVNSKEEFFAAVRGHL